MSYIYHQVTFLAYKVSINIRGHRGQNSGGRRLVTGLESAVAARINSYN